jgi:outer membrane protein OmpA-like peptidoglycan-associated protein
MKVPVLFVTATGLLLQVPAVAAQSSPAFEFGLFGQVSYFDRSLGLNQAQIGPGVRLGLYPVPQLDIEGEGALVPADGRQGRIHYIPARIRLVYNAVRGAHTGLFVGGGVVHDEFRHDADFHDNGFTGVAGARVGVAGSMTVRVASYLDYIPSPANGVSNNWNWGLQGGLSWIFGGGRTAEARRSDSLRLRAARDSAAHAAAERERQTRDSVRAVTARRQALRDSVARAARTDSLARIATRPPPARVILRGVNFDIGKAVLLPISKDILSEDAHELITHSQLRIEVAGHTDSTGSRLLNQGLSLARARAVMLFLVQHGVSHHRMTVRGYAWSRPIASNRTAAGRAQNRRVDLNRID